MPYTESELQGNLHYQSLKERDEIKYEEKFNKDLKTFLDKEYSGASDLHPFIMNKVLKSSLRDKTGTIRIFEDIASGETHSNLSQKLFIELYQRRYRTKEKTFDYIDREFKEL